MIVARNVWQVWRAGSAVIVELDGGEGRRGNRTVDFSSRHLLTVDTEEGLYLGGKPEYTEIGTIAVEHDFQEGKRLPYCGSSTFSMTLI